MGWNIDPITRYRPVNLKLSKPRDFRFFLKKNREIWPKTSRLQEFVKGINIPGKHCAHQTFITKMFMRRILIMILMLSFKVKRVFLVF